MEPSLVPQQTKGLSLFFSLCFAFCERLALWIRLVGAVWLPSTRCLTGCFHVVVFCIGGGKKTNVIWSERKLQYVQFLNGNEHSTHLGVCAKRGLGARKEILFLWFFFLHMDVCFSELRWQIVFKPVDISLNVRFYVFLRSTRDIALRRSFAFWSGCETIRSSMNLNM